MAGRVPGIHEVMKSVDARHKAGHDSVKRSSALQVRHFRMLREIVHDE